MDDKVSETIAILCALTIGMIIIAIVQRGKFNRVWFVLTLGAYAIYESAYWVARWLPLPFFEESAWNWSGKTFAVLAILGMVLALPKVNYKQLGLTARQAQGWQLGWIVALGFCAVLAIAALQFPPTSFDGDWDTLTFQLLMPSADEELFFRGLLLVMIDQTFGVSRRTVGISFGWGGILSSVMFGLIHGIGFDGGTFNFAAAHAAYTGFGGLILYWLWARTGSLAAPFVVHSFGNSIFYVL